MDVIRKHLNKLSNKTYDKLSAEIIQEIQNILDRDTNASNDTLKNMQLIGIEIFNIASSGSFYSENVC